MHDCLHYGSFREYRIWGGRVVRTAYGINRRDEYGRSYSAPDPSAAGPTRNLGVVMEGAGDREARKIARAAVVRCGVQEPEHPVDRIAYRDAVGLLDEEDRERLADPRFLVGLHKTGAASLLVAMRGYERAVGLRYAAFLAETGGDQADELHAAS
ncbi:hypothetical protein ABZ901_26080 [Actinacidiphila alni]|uniref:hypothetical protein n=1 Tax=Actinacidiphila alni TaxID=380248 RepID=UPI00340C01B0